MVVTRRGIAYTVLTAFAVAIALGVFVGLRDRSAYLQAESELLERIPRIRSGATKDAVVALLGEPTFHEREISSTFEPQDGSCRSVATSSFVYQEPRAWYTPYPPRKTLVVFFRSDNRVACVERTPTYRILYR